MNDWRKVLRCRMSGTRAGRAWMVWAIWGMLGTAFTMEGTTGTEGLGGLGMAALLTAPFWLAFVLWPLFWIWRRVRDRQLWTEKVELLVHDPESSEPFGLEVLFGRDGVRVAVDEVNGVEGLSDALTGIPTRKPDGEGALAEFARWTDTLRHADNAARRRAADQSSSVTVAGAWSEGCRLPRGPVSMSAALTRSFRASETRRWSMRSPWLFSKPFMR